MAGDRLQSGWIRLIVGLATVIVALAVAGPARGAAFTLSSDARAGHPDIAVDEGGAAHVAWSLREGSGDDTLVYCRIPPNGTSCALSRTFALPGRDFVGPQVIVTRAGEIVVVSGRCCFPGHPVLALTSGDGGATWSPPVTIASEFSGGAEWEAELGPGDFSLALSGGNSGPDGAAIWRAAPLDGSVADAKAELAPFPKAYFNSTGFPDPTSPIAAYTDLDAVFLRRWSGVGDYNSAASWLPEQKVVAGSEPKLASGSRGVYLLFANRKAPFQLFARRYANGTFPASTQRVVSDPSTKQSAIFRDFLQDPAGNLHAVFRQRFRGSSTWGVRHRVWRNAVASLDPVETLARGAVAEDLFNLRVGAGPSGAGGIVGDGNGEGPIRFLPFGPVAGGGGSNCKPAIKLGGATARALQGCFKRSGAKWVASGAVKVNGIDVEPQSTGARAGGFSITARPSQRTLTSNAPASVRIGAVVLERGPVAWKLPAKDGKVVRLNSADGSVFRDIGKFQKRLFEFPVDGDAELLIAGSGTRVPTSFRMPSILGSVTGNVKLATNAAGLDLQKLRIVVPQAATGLLRIAGIDVTYDGANRFSGSARIMLPPQYSKAITEVRFGFENGDLSLLEVLPPPFDPTLPIVGSPPSPIVGLDRVDFAYVRKPGSRLFQGGVYLLGGPKLAGLRVAELDGSIALEFPDAGQTTLSAGGKLKVVKIPFASASATYYVGLPGSFRFSGGFQFPPPGIPGPGLSGSVNGFIDLSSGKFSSAGKVGGPILGGEGVISSKGFAACIAVPLAPDIGATWKWGDPLPVFPVCPDIGSFKIAAPAAAARGAGASATGIKIAGGLREAAISVVGSGGAPDTVLTAPNGEQVASNDGTLEQGRFRVTKIPEASRTMIQIDRPPGGAYTIDTEPGSVPIARVLTARSLPKPKVSAKVVGKGRKRFLQYRIKRIAGQRVTFAEQAGGVYRELGTPRRLRGRLRFSPAPGPRGRRAIFAILDQDGAPRAKLRVARYLAPRTARLRRPGKVGIRRRGGKLIVTWSRVRGARGYRVRVNLPRDGRRLLRFTKPGKRSLRINRVERNDRARVLIAALGPDLRPGRDAVVQLRPKKSRKGR